MMKNMHCECRRGSGSASKMGTGFMEDGRGLWGTVSKHQCGPLRPTIWIPEPGLKAFVLNFAGRGTGCGY